MSVPNRTVSPITYDHATTAPVRVIAVAPIAYPVASGEKVSIAVPVCAMMTLSPSTGAIPHTHVAQVARSQDVVEVIVAMK